MEGRLILSPNSGRYAIDDGEQGRDLTCGDRIEIHVGYTLWVTGRVEHALERYAVPGHIARARGELPPNAGGYYVVSEAGGYVLGLCTGMEVRTL